ncbi:hypothetical protein LXL04_011731 [Taraxacum kok-saghyz]
MRHREGAEKEDYRWRRFSTTTVSGGERRWTEIKKTSNQEASIGFVFFRSRCWIQSNGLLLLSFLDDFILILKIPFLGRLDVYIHDYLLKLHSCANTLMTEGKVATDPIAIDVPCGFLFEWWSVFWDIFIAGLCKTL